MFNNERSSRALWRIIFVFGFLGLLSSHVFSSPIQSEATSQAVSLVGVERPDPVGVPTKVNIGIYIFDIVAVDNLSQTFTADFFVTLSWKDTRLALGPDAGQKSPRIYRKNEIWTPQMTILNERDLDIFFDDILRVDSAGHVEYRQRFQGQLTTTLELQNHF